ncbi:MAG: cytochrome C oxidase subunit IV family protein [Sulfurimonas sp.]|nr:cytochrome C oxidase subunit IV family protein [Sulfurimonas sp.]
MSKKIWMILISLTVLSFSLGYFHFINPFTIGLVLVSIVIKGELIIEYFMGLKNVASKYRFIPTLWLLIVVLLITVAYYI